MIHTTVKYIPLSLRIRITAFLFSHFTSLVLRLLLSLPRLHVYSEGVVTDTGMLLYLRGLILLVEWKEGPVKTVLQQSIKVPFWETFVIPSLTQWRNG